MAGKNESGLWGEQLAAKFLQEQGFTVLCSNYRSPYGEIDLIASDGAMLVFAEVKTRKTARFGAPAEYVTPAKQRRLIATAAQYLAQAGEELPARFDVLEIYAPEGCATQRPLIRHIKDAFQQPSQYE